jgi:hypothetical protein
MKSSVYGVKKSADGAVYGTLNAVFRPKIAVYGAVYGGSVYGAIYGINGSVYGMNSSVNGVLLISQEYGVHLLRIH